MGAKQGVSTGTAVAVIVIVLIIIGVIFMVGLKEKAPSQSPVAKDFPGMGGSQSGMKGVENPGSKMQGGATEGQPAAGGETQPGGGTPPIAGQTQPAPAAGGGG